MNRWNIPADLEAAVLARDTHCVYCGLDFAVPAQGRAQQPSWEHIVNDESIITPENIARCCMGCNASKGAKDLKVWLSSAYCQQKGITPDSVAPVVKEALKTLYPSSL